MDSFSNKTLEEIGSYVYALFDPVKQEVFYIGKGKQNRVFNHAKLTKDIIDSDDYEFKKSLKIDRITNIINSGNQVGHFILRHGLSDKEAFEVEATLIDFLNFDKFKNFNLSNEVSGHYSIEKGIATASEVENIYHAKPITIQDFKHNILIININKTYIRGNDIYDAVRKYWVLNIKRAKKMDFVVGEYRGILRAIYKPKNWFKQESTGRYYFEGQEIVDKKICDIYLGKFFANKKKGQANPVRYIEI